LSKSTDILERYWGYSSFRPLQQEIVESAIYGHDTLALLPTGGGKSICFQVPGLAREGVCLVISPLIALMEDQVINLKKKGVKAELIVSGMSLKEIDIILDNVRFGNIKFLYTSPERVKNHLFLERFKLMHVGLIAIDEAHCISQWGYDFRPSYLDLVTLREIHPETPVIAVTATATERVKEDIINYLKLRNHNYFEGDFARKNLSYEVYNLEHKEIAILHVVKKYNTFSGIVYCQTRKSTKHIAQLLHANGIQAGFYHGGMTREERKTIQESWITNKINVIVATNAFGMGIDKPDVRYVLHYQFPDSLEAYYQEAGRAGRDGLPARTMAFLEQNDIEEIEHKLTLRFPPADEVKRVYRALCVFLQIAIGSGKDETYPIDISTFVSRYNFDAYILFNSLKILELNQTLVFSENALYKTRMRFIVSNKIVYNFQVKYEKFDRLISMICRTHAGIFDQFIELDEKGLTKQLGISYKELNNQLKHLEENGLAEFNWKTELPQVTFVHERLPDDYLTISPAVLKTRKDVAYEKFDYVKKYLLDNECRSIQLVRYFGQTAEKCGVCDVCREDKKADYTPEEIRTLILDLTQTPKSYFDLKQVIGNRHERILKELIYEMTDSGEIYLENDLFVRKI
jgi:ATP-dependent DNA helicase RecQ